MTHNIEEIKVELIRAIFQAIVLEGEPAITICWNSEENQWQVSKFPTLWFPPEIDFENDIKWSAVDNTIRKLVIPSYRGRFGFRIKYITHRAKHDLDFRYSACSMALSGIYSTPKAFIQAIIFPASGERQLRDYRWKAEDYDELTPFDDYESTSESESESETESEKETPMKSKVVASESESESESETE